MRAVWVVAGVLAWSEWLNRRWSRTLVTPGGDGGAEAVVVLGYRNRGPTANAVNRWRVRAGLRSLAGADTRVIFSGGAFADGPAEARVMADYARTVLGFGGR